MSNIVGVECARVEIRNKVFEAMGKYNLETYVMNGILAEVTTEIKGMEKANIINVLSKEIKEKDEQLKKAKESAKKVLKSQQGEKQNKQCDIRKNKKTTRGGEK